MPHIPRTPLVRALALTLLPLLLQACASSSPDSLASNGSAAVDPANAGLLALAADTPPTPSSTPLTSAAPLPADDAAKSAAAQRAAAALADLLTEASPPSALADAASSPAPDSPPPLIPPGRPLVQAPPSPTTPTPTTPSASTNTPSRTRTFTRPTTPEPGPAFATGAISPTSPSPTTDPAEDPALAAALAAWTAPRPEGAATPDRSLVDLATQMAGLLRAAPPGSSDADALAAATVTSLEAIRPGALSQLDTPGSPLFGLNSADRDALRAARDRRSRPTPATTATPPVQAMPTASSPASGLRLPRVVLCSRVESFGRFTPLPSDTFPAGSPVRAIVYAEVDGFSTRPARAGDPLIKGTSPVGQVAVELSQALTLYDDATGRAVWRRGPQSAIEAAHAPRRDFYLIQTIELPRTLAIGRYNLKVTVRDATTGAEAEAVVPVTLADRPSR